MPTASGPVWRGAWGGGWLCAALNLVLWAVQTSAALPYAVPGGALPSLAPMLEQVTPAVVNIATEGHVAVSANPLFNDPFFRRFFDIPNRPRQRRTQSLGSGVIVDARRGLVLTNNHVIENADQIAVKLRDGRQFQADLVGSDPDTDVAVVKIPADKLVALPLADSEELRVGDFVVAIGNPFGLGQTVTSGIISALARSGLGITGYEDLIQTDASINPGNSGGALVNLAGQLVGINTAIFSQSGGNIGIGFAIPINMAQQVMEQLVEFGEIRRGGLGAQLQDLDPDLAEASGLPSGQGALLVNVLSGSPADKAGLKSGDVVVSINGRAVHNAADLRNRVGLARIGDRIDLVVLSEGRKKSVRATVAEFEPDAATTVLRNELLAGTTFGEIPRDSPAYGRVRGVLVHEVEPRARAGAAGLREGDIVTAVNRRLVPNLRAFLGLVNQARGQILLRVQRGSQAALVLVQ